MQEKYPTRPALPDELRWARSHLLQRVRNITLLTASDEGDPHASVVYAALTEQFRSGLHQLWYSNVDTEHSRHIDERAHRAWRAGRAAVAPVTFVLYDSGSRNPAMKLRGEASRLEGDAAVSALATYNRLRRERGEVELTLAPASEYGPQRGMYAARITSATLTLPRQTPDGIYAGEGHTEILDQLAGFETDIAPDVL